MQALQTPLPRRSQLAMAVRSQWLNGPLLDSAQLADTYGWDTVFAIGLADVNRAIVKSGATPSGFEIERASGAMRVRISGTFAPWQIVPGGDGQNLHMAIPIPCLRYDDGAELKEFDDLLALAEVRLALLPQSDGSNADGSTWMDLRIATGAPAAGENGALTGNKPVYLLELEFNGKVQPEGFEQAFIEQLLREWLVDPENLREFNHVFASVSLNARAATGAFQWLMPTHVSYAVIDRGSLEASVFALLCMTEGRSADGLAHQVSPFAIPDGHRFGLLISRERFLAKLLLPGIGLMFSGPVHPVKGKSWPQDYFTIDEKDSTITNLADIQIDKFQVEEKGESYVADLGKGNLRVRLHEAYLETQMLGLHHPLNHFLSWLHVHHTITTRSTARLTDQIFDLLPGGGMHQAVVTKDKTAEWVEIGVLSAMLVGMTAWAAARGIGRAAQSVQSAGETTAVIVSEAVVDTAPTAEQAALITREGAAVALTGLRGGVVQANQFLEGWQVANRAALLAKVTGIGLGVAQILEKCSDVHFQKSLPKFAEFAASMMAPVKWPGQQAEYVVDQIAFNGSFQVAGSPGFAD
ncbi:MAG TPA: TULIP family P47-like protein [Myxococcota bacterium]|nr:TULIP family P47-like protein [Myxococcota bacterium]